jgi:hypothetical protein
MFCGNMDNADTDNYRGSDSDRDTEEEVETAIRFFPEILRRTKEVGVQRDAEDDGVILYPVQLLAYICLGNLVGSNLKAVSFTPLF